MIKEKLKYFIINKPDDFERGIYEKFALSSEGLVFDSQLASGVGRFVTRIFDSGERGLIWHRLDLSLSDCSQDDLRITVYSSDTDRFIKNGEEVSLAKVFSDESLTLDAKLALFEPFIKKRVANASDLLLHDIAGRYVWFLIEVYSRSDKPAKLNRLKVYLPSQSWIDSLPQIYRTGDRETHFLERYLAVFQTLFEEIEAKIAHSEYNFDPECADYDFLLWIADWIDISDSWLWEEEKLRSFIRSAISLYRRRGTRESLEGIIELYTGEKPFVIEESSISQLGDESLKKLYGNDPYTVTVLVRRDCVKSDRDYTALKKIASEMLPASLNLNIVLLEPYIFAGKFSYLGVNSTLGSYKPATLDGRSAFELTTLGSPDMKEADISKTSE